MKTAEEVARDILEPYGLEDSELKRIAQALTAWVKEAIESQFLVGVDAAKKARAEALEEVRKIFLLGEIQDGPEEYERGWTDGLEHYAAKIRALKGKP